MSRQGQTIALAAVCGLVATTASTGTAGAQQRIRVWSSAFSNGAAMPARYAADDCGGINVSPPLHWSGAPAGTRGFAVTMFDPDARAGAGFWHWIVYDIPSTASGLSSSRNGAVLPARAVAATNDAGTRAYRGPCPPPGRPHHYRMTVYALRTSFVQASADHGGPTIVRRITPYLLARGSLVATYRRAR